MFKGFTFIWLVFIYFFLKWIYYETLSERKTSLKNFLHKYGMSTLFIHRFAPEYTGFALKAVCVIFLCNGYYFHDQNILGIIFYFNIKHYILV